MNAPPTADGDVVAVHVCGVIRLQDVAFQADHRTFLMACPITAVNAARSIGLTISKSGYLRADESFHLRHCLLLSCCASLIASLTSGCCANSLLRKAFCARYGSALSPG